MSIGTEHRRAAVRRSGVALVAAVSLAACGGVGASAEAAADAALRRDLQLAAAVGVTLAGGAPVAPRIRFVSAEEGAPRAAARAAMVRDARGRARHAVGTAQRAGIARATRPAVASAPPPAAEPAATDAPIAAPAPHAVAAADVGEAERAPVDGGTVATGAAGDGDGRAEGGAEGRHTGGEGGSGTGAAIGGIIGVVLRGGSVGDEDHCERHERRRRPGVAVNRRFPGVPGAGGGFGGFGGGTVAVGRGGVRLASPGW